MTTPDSYPFSPTQEVVYSVSQLNREARQILEGSFPLLWVEGELSNFKAHTSGHWYFSLKDSQAQISCALFRAQNRKVNFEPQDGMQVRVRGQVSLYEGRGSFQLIVDSMEEAGLGKLQKAFEALKKKLAAAGFFDPTHKKPLPLIPHCIGIITSPTGAALQDILSVLKRRFPALPIIIYPSLVQGETAAASLVKAIQCANRRRECDVLILARGGGSLEDLWPFNEEMVAQAIYQSELPIISGVGHEIDFTIADFVADVRAPTPSGAAEIISPDQAEKAQFLANCEVNLIRLLMRLLQTKQAELKTCTAQLLSMTPRHALQHQQQVLNLRQEKFKTLITELIHQQQLRLGRVSATLHSLSPLNTLARGYAIASREVDNKILRSSQDVQKGDKIHLRLEKDSLRCEAL